MQVKRVVSVITLASMMCSTALFASPGDTVSVGAMSCVSAAENPRVTAQLPAGAVSARVYFRAIGQSAEYYVDMRRAADGSYFAFLPIPDAKTSSINYRVATEGAKAVTSPVMSVNVLADCPKSVLTAEDRRLASNLVIGATAANQSAVPAGFSCRGVVSYITADGQLRPNEECRQALAAVAGAGGAAAAAGTATGAAVGMSTGTMVALGAATLAAGFGVYSATKSNTTNVSKSQP